MVLDYMNGGLRAPSIEVMAKSLRLAWISRLLKNEQSCDESWKVIPNYFLDKYGGLNCGGKARTLASTEGFIYLFICAWVCLCHVVFCERA